MPSPPPEIPPEAPLAPIVAGRLAAGGGSGWAAIWLVGAPLDALAGALRSAPVYSAGPCDAAKGLELASPKRVVSALQPAIPAASAPRTAPRDHERQREWMATARIGLLTATKLTMRGVKAPPSKHCFKRARRA